MKNFRYLFVLLVANAEACTIFGIDRVWSDDIRLGASSLFIAALLLGASIATSKFSRDYALARLPTSSPPPGLRIGTAAIGIATFVAGTYCLLDASGHGLGHAVLRVSVAIWMLFLSSLCAIAFYHLLRNVPRTSPDKR